MTTKLSHRFIFDSHHFKALKSAISESEFSTYLIRLMKISQNSSDHRRRHCLISKKSLKFLQDEILKLDETGGHLLNSALDTLDKDDPLKFEELEAIEDEVERTFRYANYGQSIPPGRSQIFTSDDMAPNYIQKKNQYANKSINVDICGPTAGLAIVQTTFYQVREDLQH